MRKISLIILICLTHIVTFGQQTKTINLVAQMLQTLQLDGGGQTQFWGYGIIKPNNPNYSVSLPGPVLDIDKGDSVIINFYNDSPEDHTIHLHGLDVNQANDGVPTTSFAVDSQDTTTYAFRADHGGIFFYHCHVLTTLHLTMGMYGMIVVNNYPVSDRVFDNGPKFNGEYRFLTSDMDLTWNDNPLSIPPFYRFKANYFMVNGKSGDQLYGTISEHVKSYVGDTTVLRLGNMAYAQTRYIFPPELNAKAYMSDGRILANPFDCDTLVINSGERYTIVLAPNLDINTDILVEYYEARNGNLEHINKIRLNSDLSINERPINISDIYPNPVNGIINFATLAYGDEIHIYNLSGQLVLSEIAKNHVNQIDLSFLNKGIYILEYQNKTFKIVKQ